MGNLMTSLLNSANALQVYEGALAVTQDNVTNANTPGYAKQIATLEAMPFDLTVGLPGGVRARYHPKLAQRLRRTIGSQPAERARVFSTESRGSDASWKAISTFQTLRASRRRSAICSKAFLQLSVNPNDAVSRQTVLNDATTVAQNFNDAANGVLSQQSNIDNQTRSTIASINQIAGQIAQINCR